MTRSAPTVAHKPDYAAERFAARHWIWDHSTATRTRTDDEGRTYSGPARHRLCGRIVTSKEAGAVIRVKGEGSDRSAGWGGLQSCGSVWACPVCSAKIAHERQQELADALTRWQAGDPDAGRAPGWTGMATFTMRHHKGQSLRTLWDALSTAWNATASGRAWSEAQISMGVPVDRVVKTGKRAGQVVTNWRVPIVRAVEVTHGAAGWHVHVHALLFLSSEASSAALVDGLYGMWTRWRDSLVSQGLDAPLAHGGGFHWKLLTGEGTASALSDYFTKSVYRASSEATRGDLKRARGGNRTPMQVLRDLVTLTSGELAPGDDPARFDGIDLDDDAGTWGEWERVSHGRRQLTWSQGLRDMLHLERERTDQEIADDDSAAGEVAVSVPHDVHARIVADKADYAVVKAWRTSDAAGWKILGRYGLVASGRESVPAAWQPGYQPSRKRYGRRQETAGVGS